MPDPVKIDLVTRLVAAAVIAEDDHPATATLLREAAEAIETLRMLVGIRREIERGDTGPKGRA